MDKEQETIICPSCKSTSPSYAYFCFNCGKKLRDKPPSLGIGRQLFVYTISLLAPPFGLWYAYKYLKQESSSSKIVGVVCIVLTGISIWFTVISIQKLNEMISQTMSGQFQDYQYFGY